MLQRQTTEKKQETSHNTLHKPSKKATMEQIKAYPLFARLDDDSEAMRTLQEILIHESYNEGDEIFAIKSKGEYLYLCTHGSVDFRFTDPTGKIQSINPMNAGKPFGEVAVYSRQIRTMSAHALESTAVLKLHELDIEKVFHHVPEFGRHLLVAMAERLELSGAILRNSVQDIEKEIEESRSNTQNKISKVTDFICKGWFFVATFVVILFIIADMYFQFGITDFDSSPYALVALVTGLWSLAISHMVLVNQHREEQEFQIRFEKMYSQVFNFSEQVRKIYWEKEEISIRPVENPSQDEEKEN
jgi:CRP-like cAMP-binding protein